MKDDPEWIAENAEISKLGGYAARAQWEAVKAMPFEDACSVLVTVDYWEVMLPGMDVPEAVKTSFMESMFLPEIPIPDSLRDNHDADSKEWNERHQETRSRIAQRRKISNARASAVGGLEATKRLGEKDMIAQLRRLNAITESGQQLASGVAEGFRARLGAHLIWCMSDPKGPKSLRELADLIEHGIPEGCRGGQGSPEGELWRDFCQFHLNTRRLPTKKELRDGMEFSTDDQKRDFSKFLKKIGLSGLANG